MSLLKHEVNLVVLGQENQSSNKNNTLIVIFTN